MWPGDEVRLIENSAFRSNYISTCWWSRFRMPPSGSDAIRPASAVRQPSHQRSL